MASLGEHLRTRRWDDLRYFQQDVAAAADISKGRLSELEHDRHRVAEATLRRLAAVLALDPEELLVHAQREDRLAHKRPPRGSRGDVPVGPHPRPIPARPTRETPDKPWLSSAEAAAVLGITPHAVTELVRKGQLVPARYVTGQPGRPRRLIAAAAVNSWVPGNHAYTHRRGPRPVPAGYVSLPAFAAATGLSYGALHRRLELGDIASDRIGTRRLIPEWELGRWFTKLAAEIPAEPLADLLGEQPPPADPSPSPVVVAPRSVADPAWSTALDALPLDGIKAMVIRSRYGPERRTHQAISAAVGKTQGAILHHEASALRILRDPAFRTFTCGLPQDHPLRLALFRTPGLEAELCGTPSHHATGT